MPPAEPFGYFKDENGKKQPIPEQLAALNQAKFYIKSGCTMQSVRDWLVKKTGRTISVHGLLKSIHYEKLGIYKDNLDNNATKKDNKDKDPEVNP